MNDDLRRAITHLIRHRKKASVRKAWRELEDGNIEEYYEFWIRRKRKNKEEDA